MNVIIVGCGKVGKSLCETLYKSGHDVSIIDRDEDSLEQIPNDVSVYTTVGVPIDQDVLRRAGIENCDALVAVNNDDNTNIMICEMAREVFKVPRVLGRINDPDRENVFCQFGFNTVCSTNLTVESICSFLEQKNSNQVVNFDDHSISFETINAPKRTYYHNTNELDFEKNEALFAVEHADGNFSFISNGHITIQPDDKLIISKFID